MDNIDNLTVSSWPGHDEDRPCILLTGASGLLGRYLLRDLLEARQQVAVIVRPSRLLSAQERIERIVQTWESRLELDLPRPNVLEGDLSRPQLGLSRDQRDWIASHCQSVLHNAASLSFDTADRDCEPWLTNVAGTRNLLQLVTETGIEEFHHVSTAYVCGRRSDRVFENERNVGQELSNDYELSKLEAEEMLANSATIKKLTIFRPSIIVGDSDSGFTTTFHGFYAALRLAYTIRQSMDPSLFVGDRINVRINLDGTEQKNLVPVDWVSATISHIVLSQALHGKTYHLTSPRPITTRQIHEVLEAACELHGTTRMVGAATKIEDPSDIERMFYDNMRVYDAYWRNDPDFDTSNTLKAAPQLPCPVIDQDRLMMLARMAIDQRFRWVDSPRRERVTVKT